MSHLSSNHSLITKELWLILNHNLNFKMIFRDNKIYNDYDKYDIIHWFKCLSNKQ